VLAHLLSYPDAELRAHLPELRQALHDERRTEPSRLAELDALITRLARRSPLEVEADHVELFDRGVARRCTCSSMCTATAATAARPWWTCARPTKLPACSWRRANCPTT
jgi:nitrate reductase assembly molybdenum cofactor insertion protein NarJ